MNIIIFSAAGYASGGSRQALYLAKGFQEQGHKVRFVGRENTEPMNIALQMGLDCVAYPYKDLRKTNRILRSLMSENENTVLHAFHNRGVKFAAYLGTLWKLQKLPVVCVAHRGVTNRPGNPLPYLLPGIRAYLVNSKACGEQLPLLWRKHRWHLVNNSIPAERLLTTRSVEQMRKELNIAEGKLIVGNIGQNKAAKGNDRLMRAYAAARPSLPPSNLLLVGVKSEKLAPLAQELGIEADCRFVARTEHVADYIQLISLLVFPSVFVESQPNVIMEAMSMGVPVIGSDIGGIPELIQPDCLFDPEKTESISGKIVEMFSKPERMRAIAEENLAKKGLFSTEHRLKVVMGHYVDALKEAGLYKAGEELPES